MAMYTANNQKVYKVIPKYKSGLRVIFIPIGEPNGVKRSGIIYNTTTVNHNVIYSIREINSSKVYKVTENRLLPDYKYYDEKKLDYGNEDEDYDNLDDDLDYGSEDDD